MDEKIKEYFKINKLPKPNVINYVGSWAHGDCYAVTCGWFRIKKYCVYCIKDEIYSVRRR